MNDEQIQALKKLREPFKANQISKLPKPTTAQTNEVKQDYKKGIRCDICGGWHHPKVVHLDYVGHAALTDRLLDVDPAWNWKPLSSSEHGLPLYDSIGGLWIELTVSGMTRLGYGHAGTKQGGDAIKEVIGDALRNAAMRFGAALDLWHKGELHQEDTQEEGNNTVKHKTNKPPPEKQPAPEPMLDVPSWIELFNGALTEIELKKMFQKSWYEYEDNEKAHNQLQAGYDLRKVYFNKGDEK